MRLQYNQIQLTGRAGHDVDLHTLTDGTPFARLNLYHNDPDAPPGAPAIPFAVTCWGKLAATFQQAVRRGDHLLIHGRLRLRKFRESGVQHIRPEIHLDRFFLTHKARRPAEEERGWTATPPAIASQEQP